MKNPILIILLCAMPLLSNGQGWAWANNTASIAGNRNDFIAVDVVGDVITTGENYLTKRNASGSIIWTKGPSEFNVVPLSVATDALGNILVCGFFTHTVTLGTITLTNVSLHDIFFAKFDADGNVLWAKGIGGGRYDDAYSITTDNSGNVLVAGAFSSSSLSFGATTITTTHTSMFLAKYNTNGHFVWVKEQTDGTYRCVAKSIKTNAAGEILVTGYFEGPSITFGATTLTNASTMTSPDVFVAKYDAAGNVLWAKSAGGKRFDFPAKLDLDNAGNIYIAGNFDSDTIAFGAVHLGNEALYYFDMFVASYDPGGNLRWAKRCGEPGDDMLRTISVSGNSVYVAGTFASNSITFGSTTLTNGSPGNLRLFLARYNTSGGEEWALTGGDNGNSIDDIYADNAGSIFVTGLFFDTQLELGPITLTRTGGSLGDKYVAKYRDGPMEVPTNGATPDISIAPNPVDDVLLVTSPVAIKHMQIIDVTGRTVLEKACGSEKVLVNVSQLIPGYYRIILNGRATKGFIKR